MSKILLKDVIGSKIAVSPEKGTTLYNFLNKKFKEREFIELSFEGIEDLTTAFLNRGIGNLYKLYTSDELNKYLKISQIDDMDRYLLSKVIERAKIDISNNRNLSETINEVIDDE